MAIEEQVRTYIIENFLLGGDQDLSASQSLLDSGVVDSTGVLELVAFLEQSFGIEVKDADMVPENLDTIGNIAAFVRRTQAGREAQATTAERRDDEIPGA
jgi:acyl carrier protein